MRLVAGMLIGALLGVALHYCPFMYVHSRHYDQVCDIPALRPGVVVCVPNEGALP